MFNKIAVVLRGHVRTWPQISQVVFKNFNKISNLIDYYFITWDIPGLDEDKIIKSFKGQNLVKFIKVNNNQHYNNSHGPSWLANNMYDYLLPTNYDVIFDSRPDIVPVFFKHYHEQLEYTDNSVYVLWESIVTDGNTGISDCFQYMSKDVYKVFCDRYKTNHIMNAHVDLRNVYLEDNINIIPSNGFMFYADIIRPTQIDQIYLYESSIDKIWENKELLISLWNKWDNLSEQDKITMLNEQNILLEDYYLK